MKTAVWLAWGELCARKGHFIGGAALVAAAVALFSATELVSRAREAAVASQMDYLGPSLHLVATGVTSTKLASFELGDGLVPERTIARLRSERSHWLRAIEGRLLLTARVGRVKSPIIGMTAKGDAGSLVSVRSLGPDGVLLGADLARRLGRRVGERVEVLGGSWRIQGILPPLGSSEDLALIMQLAALQEARGVGRSVNEIRIHLEPEVRIADVTAWLGDGHPELNVLVNTDRGQDAERETGAALRQHREVVYWLTGLAVAIGLMTAAYINAGERRVEMAMLVAMGGTTTAVFVTLVARAGIVGLVGAAMGYTLGAGIAIAQDASSAVTMTWSWARPAAVVLVAAGVSVGAAIPASVQASYQDHVRALQEW